MAGCGIVKKRGLFWGGNVGTNLFILILRLEEGLVCLDFHSVIDTTWGQEGILEHVRAGYCLP